MKPTDKICVVKATLSIEPGIKIFGWVKNVWQQEVEERPELVKVILQRCAGQQEPVSGLKFSNNFWELWEENERRSWEMESSLGLGGQTMFFIQNKNLTYR